MNIYKPTVQDFITMYGQVESVEITNLDNVNATAVNAAKLQMAIDDAHCWFCSYLDASQLSARALIAASSRRVICIVARYYCDTLRTRENVRYDYEQCVKELALQNEAAAKVGKWQNPYASMISQSRGGRPISLVYGSNRRNPNYSIEEYYEEYRNTDVLPNGLNS